MANDPEAHRDAFVWHGGPGWDSLRGTARKIHYHVTLDLPTLLRARNRSDRSRVRSVASPWGVAPVTPAVARDNALVRNVIELIVACVGHSLGSCTIEGPADGFLWALLDEQVPGSYEFHDVEFSACMFGSPARRTARLRTFGTLCLAPLAQICTSSPQGHACGRSSHFTFGVGGQPPPASPPEVLPEVSRPGGQVGPRAHQPPEGFADGGR